MPAQFSSKDGWIALSIGNSRLHWGLFFKDSLQQTCHTPPLDPLSFLDASPQTWSDWQQLCPLLQAFEPSPTYPEVLLASVVSQQTELWLHYPHVAALQQFDIPLGSMYPSFGLDRAIALWGAGMLYGWPVLVIDGGTALTVTGADANACLVGGAISPGLGLQAQSLQEHTAHLPWVEVPTRLPDLWATDTETALQSGIVYSAIANLKFRIEQWCRAYPSSQIILTGGDGEAIYSLLQQSHPPEWQHYFVLERDLIFKGIAALRSRRLSTTP